MKAMKLFTEPLEWCSDKFVVCVWHLLLARNLPRFLELLTHVDVEVRSAAGENIAMLYEASQKCGLTLPYDEDIIEKFRVMSKDSSKKNSKKDRKVQRMVFRDVHATLAVGFWLARP